jgi:hypothetical protein
MEKELSVQTGASGQMQLCGDFDAELAWNVRNSMGGESLRLGTDKKSGCANSGKDRRYGTPEMVELPQPDVDSKAAYLNASSE